MVRELDISAEPPRRGNILFPLRRRPPEPGVFELALVLGGTLSAGPYTAGALDFLLEALEAWHAQDAPPHHLRIPFAAGSSGGAVCAAMLAVMTRGKVPHVHGSYQTLLDERRPRGNPLWDLWVNEFEIESLLETSDLGDGARLMSLLDTALQDRMEAQLVAFAKSGEDKPAPCYFPSPFRVAVTLTNVRGIPYRMDGDGPQGFTGAMYVQHDDYARFAVPNRALLRDKREDEFWLTGDGSRAPGVVGYEVLARYATASGAAPAVLSARDLTRPVAHYLYRPLVRPIGDPPGYRVEWPKPDWRHTGLGCATDYGFTASDGGLFNDDPVALAHEALTGLIGTNPRHPALANRAIFMIDPLVQLPQRLPLTRPELRDLLPKLFNVLVQGGRYRTADLALFGDSGVFSRFHLVPWRDKPRLLGAEAVIGSRLSGLAGFFCRAWRVHDFLLGRCNMQNYIRGSLILRADNLLFDRWCPEQRARFAVSPNGAPLRVNERASRCDYYLPVLPDLTATPFAPPDQVPLGTDVPWPRAMPVLARLRPRLRRRIGRVLREAMSEVCPGYAGRAAGCLAVPFAAWRLECAVIAELMDEMRDSDLFPRNGRGGHS
jgi:hypothetical protein